MLFMIWMRIILRYQTDEMGEEVPNAYLEELLRGFSFNKGTEYRLPDESLGADGSDGEYKIFEQDSDDNEDLFDDVIT